MNCDFYLGGSLSIEFGPVMVHEACSCRIEIGGAKRQSVIGIQRYFKTEGYSVTSLVERRVMLFLIGSSIVLEIAAVAWLGLIEVVFFAGRFGVDVCGGRRCRHS